MPPPGISHQAGLEGSPGSDALIRKIRPSLVEGHHPGRPALATPSSWPGTLVQRGCRSCACEACAGGAAVRAQGAPVRAQGAPVAWPRLTPHAEKLPVPQTLDPPPDSGSEDRAEGWPNTDDAARPSIGEARRARRAQYRRRATYEWIVAIVVAVAVAFVIKTWVAQTFVIPSGSMENTLLINDRVLVSKLSYRFGDVQRGDVIVFDNPECGGAAASSCQYKQLIKRVIGVGGDEVTDSRRQGRRQRRRAGRGLREARLHHHGEGRLLPLRDDEVDHGGPGELFVMGDNRNSSKDGRCFGPVSEDAVVGKAFVRVWPLDRLGGL